MDLWRNQSAVGDHRIYKQVQTSTSSTQETRKINQLIGEVSSKVSKTDYNTLNGRVTNAESNITQQATQIASKVSQTDFNAEKTKISNLQTSVTQQSDQIALKANQTEVSNLTGRVSTAEGKITTRAGQIALKAEKTYVDTVKQTVDSTTSRVTIAEQSITSLVSGSKTLPDGRTSVFATKIESQEGAITQRVTTQELNNRGYQTSSQVNDIVDNKLPTNMGGRNLVRGSEDLKKGSQGWSQGQWRNNGSGGTVEYNVQLPSSPIKGITTGAKITSDNSNQIGLCQDGTSLEAGTYTLSVWVLGSSGLKVHVSSAHSQDNSNPYTAGNTFVTLQDDSWTLITQTFTLTKRYNNLTLAYLMFDSPGTVYYATPYIHKSTLPGDWSPAPEDYDADLTDRLAGYVTNQTYTTYTTARQQTDQQITEQINQTVSKVPTGPVNLVINGFDPQTVSPWTSGGSGNSFVLATHNFFYNSQKKMYMLSTANTNEVFSYTNVFNLKRNTKYTLRIGLFANSVTRGCDIFFMKKPAGGSFTYQHLRLISDLSPSKVVYYTMTFDSGSFDLGQFRIDNNGSTTQGSIANLYICEVSCIEGEYNNSWTPSFDELITEQKFNETKSTVDAFSRA